MSGAETARRRVVQRRIGGAEPATPKRRRRNVPTPYFCLYLCFVYIFEFIYSWIIVFIFHVFMVIWIYGFMVSWIYCTRDTEGQHFLMLFPKEG